MLKIATSLRTLAVAMLVVLALSAAGCDGDGGGKAPQASPTVKPEVPAPPGLIAELTLTGPRELLADLREAAGGPALFLPRTVGGLLVNLFGLPLQATEIFDEQLPVLAASATVPGSPAAPPDWCVGVHVREAAALLTVLTGGRDARFSSTREGDHVWLEAKPGNREARLTATVGLLDNYLLSGPSRDALKRLGPYVARTLARRSPAKQRGVSIDLREGAAGPELQRRLAMLRTLVSAMPLRPPWSAVLDVDATLGSLAELVAGLKSGHVEVTLDERAFEVDATLAMAADPPALAPSAAADLLTLPDDTLAALTWSQSAAGRDAGAAEQARTLSGLLAALPKAGLTEETQASLASGLGSLARGRGDRTTAAVRCTGVGITGMAVGDVASTEMLAQGVKEIAALAKHKAVKEALKGRGLELSGGKTRIVELPEDVWRWRLTPTAPSETEARLGVIDMLTSWNEQRFLVAAGLETIDTLQLLRAPDAARSWSQKDTIKSAVARLPPKVWLAVVVDPQATHACLLGNPGGSFAAPLALGVGPGVGTQVTARLTVARPLLRFLAKELGGF